MTPGYGGPGQRGQWERVIWFLLLLVFHRRDETEYGELGAVIVERARASQFRLLQEAERMGKTMAQVVEARGDERGEARGLRLALEDVLVERFDALPEEARAALEQAEPETVRRWLRRTLSAATLAEVGILGPAPRS